MFFYHIVYRPFQKLIRKKHVYENLNKYIDEKKIKIVYDIGCADSLFLKYNTNPIIYYGFDINPGFIQKSKEIYNNNTKFNFECSSAAKIASLKFEQNSIVLMCGLIHHLNDNDALSLISNINSQNVQAFAIDPLRKNGQGFLNRLLISIDRGDYIRNENQYKNIFQGFDVIHKNNFLRFKFDHIMHLKKLDKNFFLTLLV